MGTLGRTWSLYKESFNVLSADAEIVLLAVVPYRCAGTGELPYGFTTSTIDDALGVKRHAAGKNA